MNYKFIFNRCNLYSLFMLTVVFCVASIPTINAQVVINEIMQGNVNCFYSEEKNPDSWVELYNPSDSIASIDYYRLGSSPVFSEALEIKNVSSISPKGYTVVMCDKNVGNVLDRLSTDGGVLYLFDEYGKIVDTLSYLKMKKPDVSWGRVEDGDTLGNLLRPTPGGKNSAIAETFPSKVRFSAEGGVWEHFDPFYVELTSQSVPDYYSEQLEVDSSLCIRYTLDGSEPTEKSDIYKEPIYVENSTVIRAKVFDPTKPLLTSNSVSYIYHGRPVDKSVVSLITDSLYYYGEEYGIMGNRQFAKADNRRPMNFEYFPLDSTNKSVNIVCKARGGGNTSRLNDAYMNLVLFAKKAYGDKHFKTTFWPHQKPSVDESKSVYLRCSSKNDSYLVDAVSCNMASYLDVDYQATDALSVYMNGKFYGLLYMYERSNEDYVWENYNKLEDVDFILLAGHYSADVMSGTIDEFNKFKKFWESAPHSLDEWRKWMDIDEYTNSMAIEIFGANVDFWVNNTRIYRSRVDSSAVWRWVLNDLDQTFRSDYLDVNYFQWIVNGNPKAYGHKPYDYSVRLWSGLMKSEEYKSYFLDRIIAYHGDFLNKRAYCACADSLYNLTQKEIELTNSLYYHPSNGLSLYNAFKKKIVKRSDYFHTDLQSFFKLDSAVVVKVNNTPENDLELFYNNIKLKTRSFDGWDFVGRTVRLQTKDADNEIKSCNWIVEISKGDTIETEKYSWEEMLTYVIPSGVDTIVFTPSISPIDDKLFVDQIKSLTDIELYGSKNFITVWDLYGRQLYRSDRNQNIVLPKRVPLIISVEGQVKKVMF